MRTLTPLLVPATLLAAFLATALALPALWSGARAHADEPDPQPAPTEKADEGTPPVVPPAPVFLPEPGAMETVLARLDVLEARVAYLTSREKALTTYVLGLEARAQTLAASLRIARQQGFTAGAIAAPSREALLSGLETLARTLPKDLPALTKEEARILQSLPKAR